MPDSPTDQQLQDTASNWLAGLGIPTEALSVLRGDVSLRRYLRAHAAERTLIVAVYPAPIRSSCETFLITTGLLKQAGIRVPDVVDCDCAQGFMLLEDLGDKTLYELQGRDSRLLEAYFWRAASDLDRVQSIDLEVVASLNPPLDEKLLRRELIQTRRHLFAALPTSSLPGIAEDLDQLFDSICRRLGEEPIVPCHRDFMARNLVPLEPVPDLGVLDHQDLRPGPKHYDLASVLNDSLFPSPELEEAILTRMIGDRSQNRERYHRAAAQRTLKATGTYLMFAERGFERHRKLVPATLERALAHLSHLPEAAGLQEALSGFLGPLLAAPGNPDRQ